MSAQNSFLSVLPDDHRYALVRSSRRRCDMKTFELRSINLIERLVERDCLRH